MIKKLENNSVEVADKIQSIFYQSYTVEAKLLDVVNFPPLKRPLESFLKSENLFFGYFENVELVGVIELEHLNSHIDINSLVVNPRYFRSGIAGKLLSFIFDNFDAKLFTVETGANNASAVKLYEKFGFKAVRLFDTDLGIKKIGFERRI